MRLRYRLGLCEALGAIAPDIVPPSTRCTEQLPTRRIIRCQHRPGADGIVCSDGNICTVGDTCNSGECHPGTSATPGDLSEFVIGRVGAATSACINIGDRAKVWTKISLPLGKASWMLYQANSASGGKLRRGLSQARASVALATRRLSQRRSRLSSTCGARLDEALASANAALTCVP